jgi:putative membrane protein
MKGLLAAASACALLIAAPAWAQTAMQSATAAQHLNQQDKSFVKTAGDGNFAEAGLGKLAEQKAATPAVKEFGRWMATDHSFANKRLAAELRPIDQTLEPTLTAQDRALKQKLDGLTGSQFDREYMQAQVQDHEKTIRAFQQEATAGENQRIKTYAQDLIPVLEQHLAEARELASGAGMAAGTGTSSVERSGSSMPPR